MGITQILKEIRGKNELRILICIKNHAKSINSVERLCQVITTPKISFSE